MILIFHTLFKYQSYPEVVCEDFDETVQEYGGGETTRDRIAGFVTVGASHWFCCGVNVF
jgi:hypothetical protein